MRTRTEPSHPVHKELETTELQATLAWHEAVTRLALPRFDWRIERIGDALCSVSVTETSSLMNRVFGFGSQLPPTPERLTAIRHFYRQSGIGRFFLHVTPELMGSDMERMLTESGYKRYRGWMKFTRGTEDTAPVSTDLTVRQIGPEKAAEFAAIAAPAFDMSPASQAAIAALAEAPGWHLFMSFDGDRPAGTGAVYISGSAAYTDWGATHPDFRRRGSQTAILSERIRYALEAGCNMIVTMTGEAVPGDPQHSYSNILKRGFEEAYLRENWIPGAT